MRAPEIIRAPWDAITVRHLNVYQSNRYVHPYICGGACLDSPPLVATPAGWRCTHCGYAQDWAHAAAAKGVWNQVPAFGKRKAIRDAE